MPDTHGFEVVAEIKESVLGAMLRAAWDNGGTGDPGAIPHEVSIPPGIALGPYQTIDGQVAIPRSGLSLVMSPPANGVTVQMLTEVQVHLDPATTHLQTLGLFDMSVTLAITAPIGPIAGSNPNIGVIFDGLPRSAVVATVTSGHPVAAVTVELVTEYVHGLYIAGEIPHAENLPGQTYPPITFDAHFEIWDDQEDPARAIAVSVPDATHVKLSLPILVRLSDLHGVAGIEMFSPMAAVARLILIAPLERLQTKITAKLSQAVVSVEDVGPADGPQGANYVVVKGFYSTLDALFAAEIQARGHAMVASLDDMVIPLPSLTEIEALIGDKVHQAVVARRYVGAWTPATPAGSPITVTEARPKTLADALAIGINPGASADANLLGDFVPSGKSFAIGLDADFVERTIGTIIARSESEGGLGGIPKEFPDIEGHRVTLHRLDWDLQAGKIRFTGSCTVYDVFCGADADVDFWADIGLEWSDPDATGAQKLVPYLIDSDASLPWWAWLLVVVGFLIGLILGVIMLVITIVIERIAERIGAAVIRDEVSGQVQALGAWPQQLQGVGKVTSTFDKPVIIESSGLVFTGTMLVTATYALTAVSFADANGPYSTLATVSLSLQAGPPAPSLSHVWSLGDGVTAAGNLVSHVFLQNGLYVVRVATRVNEPGGGLTHQFTRVKVRNVRPVVDVGPDIHVKEGQTFTVTAHFEDREWLDKHEAIWDFGDDSLPVKGSVVETNDPPAALGTVTASHTYCNNGLYTVRLRLRDQDGGIAEGSLTARVENVAPCVSTAPYLFAYPCVPVTLVARFVDPGWCDTHRAWWKFGDGDFMLEATPATVREVHEPPFGFGIAAATHTYHALATHLAECIVVDSDGARGRAHLTVVVVDLMNKHFEAGFRSLGVGTVANEWTPFSRHPRGEGKDVARFEGEQFIVRDGQRSQCVRIVSGGRAGLFQRVPANLGWDYQVVAHQHVAPDSKGVCMLGLDPRGGEDPGAASVVWATDDRPGEWHKLLVRVTAETDRVTVFLAAEAVEGTCVAHFDAVAFEPYPCPLAAPRRPDLPEQVQTVCVDFKDEREARTLPRPYKKLGFGFESAAKRPLRIVLWGQQHVGELSFPDEGMRVTLPFVADSVKAAVESHTRSPVRLQALAADNTVLGETQTVHDGPQTLEVSGHGITAVHISGGGQEGLLAELCAMDCVRASPCECVPQERQNRPNTDFNAH